MANEPLTDQQLDELLQASREHTVTPGLETRILALAEPIRDPWEELVAWISAGFWRPAGAFLAPLMLGILIGAGDSLTTEQSEYLSDYPWVEMQEDLIDE